MADAAPTKLNCPSCGAPLEVDGTNSVIRCKFCKNIALIPGLPSAEDATPRASLNEIRQLVQRGNLVDAIRRYCELYGVDTAEAKDAVDALAAGKVADVHRVFSGPVSAEETSHVLEDVKALLRSGDKLGAIKRYREFHDVSLTQAKYVVEQVEAAQTGGPPPTRPEIPGHPITAPQPVKTRNPAGCAAGIIVLLVLIAGALALVFSQQAGKISNPFVAPLHANGSFILAASGNDAAPDVVGLFYDSEKDTRMIGLVDGTTGSLRWQAAPLPADGFADGLVASGTLVYAASGSTLLAYNKTDGSLAWQTQMPDRLNYGANTLLVTAGRVITLNNNQSIQAYDAASGGLAWDRRLAGNDNSLRLMNGSLAVLDYVGDSYNYSLIFLSPVDGSQQRVIDLLCKTGEYSSDSFYTYSGLIYVKAENALYLVYDSYDGCIQRIDFTTGQLVWQNVTNDSFSFSPYGFNVLMTDPAFYFRSGGKLLMVDKSSGAVQTVLTNEDYDIVPLAVTGDAILVRARRTRGTERFELWDVDATSGKSLWQTVLQGASPIDPPMEMSGLVDDTDSGWTWKLTSAGLVLIKFQAAPNQMVLETINPGDGTVQGQLTVPLADVTGDFYSVPSVIGWQGNVVYLQVESQVLALDVTTGKVLFSY
jgi:outer membrane protein assembly factor BamB/ribosomal protein L7/L12